MYQITISTPLVCTKYLENASLQRLEYLGVFGFSKGSGGGKGGNSGSKSKSRGPGGGVRKKTRKN